MYQSTVLQNTTLQSSLLMPILYLIQKCKDITRNNSTVFRTFSFTASQRLFLIRHWLGVLICCHVTGRELTLASARLLKFKLFLRKGKWANFNWLWMWRGCRCCSENCRKCCSEGMFTHRPPFMFVKKKGENLLWAAVLQMPRWCQQSEASGQSILSWWNRDCDSNNHKSPIFAVEHR